MLLLAIVSVSLGFNLCQMLSVGSREGRKRMGLGLDMEETELEEGEALGYQERKDSTIDPDIALSYIVRILLHSSY